MQISQIKSINKKIASKKALSLYLILAVFIFLNWGFINRFLYFEAAQIRDYIQKEFLEIDSLSFNQSRIDTMYIIFDKEELASINRTRVNVVRRYLRSGEMNIKKHEYHDSFVMYKNYKATSEIKLFGMNPDHYLKNKTSFRIKFRGGDFFAKKKVNLLSPKTRSYQMDHVLNQAYKNKFNAIAIEQVPIILSVNNKSKGVYFIEDFFDKYLIEKNNKKESFIFESGFNGKFQGSVPISKLNTEDGYFNINTIPKGKKWKNISKRIIDLFQNNNPNELFNIIDGEKLNAVIGLCLLAQDHHPLLDINLHWYYNTVNNKLEPLIRESYIYEIPPDHNIDDIWENFYTKTKKEPGLKLIKEWMDYQENNKELVTQSALKSALYIQEYITTDKYKSFISQLNKEFSYNLYKQNIALKHNISQIITKINLIKNNQTTYDSTVIINNNITIDKDFIIDDNTTLIINKGVSIKLSDNANMYIYGKIFALGEASNSIKFIGNQNSNSSIYINSTESKFNFCQFIGLSALNNNLKFPLFKDLWTTSSAVTLYESSNVVFWHCLFRNNQVGDDMINAVSSTDVAFNNCSFENIVADALDSDFSDIDITNCKFILIGNDAIDGSKSNIKVKQSYFENIADKAISVGEESVVSIINGKIINSEQALVVKDGSLINAKNITLENNRMDLIAFSKKEEYNSPKFNILGCTITNYLIDKKAHNIGEGNYYRTSQSIQDILYGEQYGKASEK